jgi:hypothetical protein
VVGHQESQLVPVGEAYVPPVNQNHIKVLLVPGFVQLRSNVRPEEAIAHNAV